MNLRTYVKSLTTLERKTFCEDSEISQAFMSQLLSNSPNELNRRRAGRRVIARAIAASGGQISADSEFAEDVAEATSILIKKKKQGKAA